MDEPGRTRGRRGVGGSRGRAACGRRVIAALLGVAMALVAVAVGRAAIDDTQLVTRATGAAGVKGNGESMNPYISDDGRYVAFHTASSNLSSDDGDTTADIYVRDLQTLATVLVSRASGVAGAKGNGPSDIPSMSSDGRYVAFTSASTNLDPADTDATADVYVRDLQTDTTTLVSRATGAQGAKGDALSRSPVISGDGRYIAFVSDAANLDPADGDALTDIYVRDLQTATTRLVSRATGAAGAKANGATYNAVISTDGTRVAFHSYGTNLDPSDADATPDVFVRDLQANTTTLASRVTGPVGPKGNGSSIVPALSGDGRLVVFTSAATNLDASDQDATQDVYVRDLQANTTTLISRASGAGGTKSNGAAYFPEISSNGRYAAWYTRASNLDPVDGDTNEDVYVRDLQANTTTLISRASGAAGAKGDGYSYFPELSADGRLIAFESSATNFDPADGDTMLDIYVRDVLGPPATQTTPTVTTTSPPPPPPPPPPDSDRDGLRDDVDACPQENPGARDDDHNGCRDYSRVRGRFVLYPGKYVRLARDRTIGGYREVRLGVRVRALYGSGLTKGATVTLTCTRGACRRERLKVGANGRVRFMRVRGARLPTGTKVTLVATLTNAVGLGVEYTISPRQDDLGPKRRFCIRPGGTRRGSCSTQR